ncbi:MAG: AraC family transcriptional regulator [Eubacteriales bacterium]|nr:AraC family transcriptional regulator [Eubacteriales bacterium]
MTDVRKVYITREVADELNLTPTYLIKLAKKLKLSESEMREAGNRNYLFSEEAVEKLKNRNEYK